MVERLDKVEFVDRSLEAAESALDNPVVSEQLGSRAETLFGYLERFVPVFSSEDSEHLSGVIFEPDTVPLLLIAPGEAIKFNLGVDQFSDQQRRSAVDRVETWQPRDYSPEEAVGILEKIRKYQPTNAEHAFRRGAQSALFSEDTIVNGHEFSEKLSLQEGPADVAVQISFRGLMCVYMAKGQQSLSPAALLHELVHLNQIEERPLRTYSSQKEYESAAIRRELEAYNVGATVIAALAGENIADMKLTDRDSRTQILVEQSRLASPDYDPADPFMPNKFMLMLIENGGLRVEELIDNSVDLARVLEWRETTQPTRVANTIKNKKGGRYTPPKSKR